MTRRGLLPSGEQSGQTGSAMSHTLDKTDLTFDIPDLLGKAILRERPILDLKVAKVACDVAQPCAIFRDFPQLLVCDVARFYQKHC
jgi:hypothetical protein